MIKSLETVPGPQVPASRALIAVDRAIAELRRGGQVAIAGASGAWLIQAAEASSGEALAAFSRMAGGPPAMAITGRRASVLNLAPSDEKGIFLVHSGEELTSPVVAWLSDPGAEDLPLPFLGITLTVADPSGPVAAAVILAKLARLLPAVLLAPVSSAIQGAVEVAADDILFYRLNAARSLRIVSQAQVPLKDAENARIVAFRPADGGIEHLAVIVGEPDGDQPVLTRLHSECFTGDLLGSLRCDCGDQLRGALAEISQAGSGVLLYLSQEGRGIGLVNKLRAYRLQDQGFDTLDANLQLGFDDDERLYLPAAQMLRLLGIGRVRLMTNNPLKVAALARHGIDVTERVPHVFPANDHNQGYLRTKATRSGHLF